MMKSSVIAIMLALAKGQQVCKIDYWKVYSDPECKNQIKTSDDDPEVFNRANEIISQGTKCQKWEEKYNVKFRGTCIDSETIKWEVHNIENEDPECKFPYPSYSWSPSYVAKNEECVQTSMKEWVRMTISSTTGKFEKTENSPELFDYNKQVTKDEIENNEDAIKDRSADANSCMLKNFNVYMDKDCKTENTQLTDPMKDFFLFLGNTEIQSTECLFFNKQTNVGVKARGWCEDGLTFVARSYNGLNEDPHCLRAYPDDAQNYTSFKARNGECVYMGNQQWAIMEIEKYDGRKWEWNPEWEKMFAPDQSMSTGGMSQKMSFKGEGYEVSVDMSMGENGAQKTVTETKFDNYFMYAIDQSGPMDGRGYNTPQCGPEAERDMCKEKVFSQDTCCANVVMNDRNNNMMHSFYRCMNMMIVDASFSVEIDGHKMSMACTGDMSPSAASYFSGAAFLASIVTLMTMSIF